MTGFLGKNSRLRNVLAAGLLAVPSICLADSVTVSPTRLSVIPPAQQTTLRIKADGTSDATLQFRVLRWKEGTDPAKAEPTRDVVISPPFTQLAPRKELTVRIVRVGKRPVKERECYRVLVDRLPGRDKNGRQINMLVRQSIPLCFET